MTSLKLDKGNLVLKTPFNRDLVDDLKSTIPLHGRAWNPQKKVWEIAYVYGHDVVDIVQRHLGETISIPKQVTRAKSLPETRLIEVHYIGAAKEREDGSIIAMGCDAQGQWSVVFDIKVLKEFFEGNGDANPNQVTTFYGILGVPKNADSKQIKKAYRIAAKTWHPDINDDPNASEQFRLIQTAYETLSDDLLKRKYNAGLYLQNKAEHKPININDDLYRPPKRCGYLTVEGEQVLNRFVVKHILQWDEIHNSAGQTMVSYWPKYGNKYKVDWI